MADAARAARLADRIKVIVAQALERRVKDPRLGFVTVTDARVTNDLQHATLYYTVYGSEEEQENTKRRWNLLKAYCALRWEKYYRASDANPHLRTRRSTG